MITIQKANSENKLETKERETHRTGNMVCNESPQIEQWKKIEFFKKLDT